MASALQHYVSYNSIPLSKRIEKHLLSDQRNAKQDLKGRDVNWRSGINTIDPETGLTPLMVAILQGKKDIVVALIERGAEVEIADSKKGRIPLQIAAKVGQVEIVKELLKRDCVVNSADKHKKTALMHAAKEGYLDCVNVLLNNGAGVNMIDDCGYSALHYAARYGHHEVAIALMKSAGSLEPRDNNEGFAALHFAAQYGRKETLLALLNYGARINRRTSKEKLTPLMLAAREGNKTIVSILISKGAEVNLVDIHGWTALHFAASWGRRDTAHILIVDGQANVNICPQTRDSVGGTTPLVVAAKSDHIPVIKLLLNYGADINQPELYQGQTPLASAAEFGNANAIQVLLDYSADINYQNHFTGTTALMTAVRHGKRSAIVTLLNNYADINIIDFKFQNVFDHSDIMDTRDILLSAMIHISPAAKVNLIPWLEVSIPFLDKHSSTYGGPSQFLSSFLYNNEKGLYYGLYNQTRDHDVYLIYCLIILLATCQKSINYHPKESYELTLKIQEIHEMLENCLLATNMLEENIFMDCFLLGSLPIKELLSFDNEITVQQKKEFVKNYYINYYKYFHNAFFFGPLACYLENNFTKLLKMRILSTKIDESFVTYIKSPTYIIDGYGGKSKILLFRYNVQFMFYFELLSRLCWIAGILVYCFQFFPSSNYFLTNHLNAILKQSSSLSFNAIEIFLVLMTITNVFYEIGLMEEKRWMIAPSIIFDYTLLEKIRYDKVYTHFLETPWKILDFIIIVLSLTWCALKFYFTFAFSSSIESNVLSIAYYQSVSGELLILTLIPLTLNCFQYLLLWNESLHIEILTIFMIFKDLFIYLLVFLAMIFSFSIFYFTIYHQEIESFSTMPRTIQTLFNGILLNYDSSLFDHSSLAGGSSSNNGILGILISLIFFILTVFIFFNGIIGNISSNYSKNKEMCTEWSIQMKCFLIRKFSPILEKSAFSMLPPFFNSFNILLYGAHVYYMWRARLALREKKCISIAGTFSDYLISFFLLIPCAIYEYIEIDLKNPKNGFLGTLFYAPIGISYIIYCFLYKFSKEPAVRVILKTRLSDGRLRVSYSIEQDLIEENALSQFEDQRIFKDLQRFYEMMSFNEQNNKNNVEKKMIASGLKPEEIDAIRQQMKKDAEDRQFATDPLTANQFSMSDVNNLDGKGKEPSVMISFLSPGHSTVGGGAGGDYSRPGDKIIETKEDQRQHYWSILWNRFFQKRSTDFIGKQTRISPYNPFIQLNNLQEPIPEVLPVMIQAKPHSIEESIYLKQKILKEKIERKKKFLYLAEDLHSEYHASLIPNVSEELNSILQENPSKPNVLWVTGDDEHVSNSLTKDGKVINPYQPGILKKDQWDELAGETEPKGADIAFTGGPGKKNKKSKKKKTKTTRKGKKSNTLVLPSGMVIDPFGDGGDGPEAAGGGRGNEEDDWGDEEEDENDDEDGDLDEEDDVSEDDHHLLIALRNNQAEAKEAEDPPEDRLISPKPSLMEGSMFSTMDGNHLFQNPNPTNNARKPIQQPTAKDYLDKKNAAGAGAAGSNRGNPAPVKIFRTNKFFHHADDKYLIDEQAMEHFHQLNYPSLYFSVNCFPAIFSEQERKGIFQKVLKNLFIDDFAYQIEKNEKYFYELKKRMTLLEQQNRSQQSLLMEVMKSIKKNTAATNRTNSRINNNNNNNPENNAPPSAPGTFPPTRPGTADHHADHYVFHEYDNPYNQPSHQPNYNQNHNYNNSSLNNNNSSSHYHNPPYHEYHHANHQYHHDYPAVDPHHAYPLDYYAYDAPQNEYAYNADNHQYYEEPVLQEGSVRKVVDNGLSTKTGLYSTATGLGSQYSFSYNQFRKQASARGRYQFHQPPAASAGSPNSKSKLDDDDD